ncbi:MAG: hypothetical protein JWP38_3315 [Herbaspirillum sp.]|jgi:tetratricopeptide (TPR) repeat protein|nr:hypothetical protein [Herbaspirillum sp.]
MPIKLFTPATPPNPDIDGKIWIAIGQERLAAGNPTEALQALQRAATMLPLNADVYRVQAAALHANGQQPQALAAGMAVEALERGSAVDLFNIGTAYFMNRHWEPAGHWYRLALMLDPDLVSANQNLAEVLRQQGRSAEADEHSDRAYRRQSLFIEPAATPVRNVLILCCGRPGNVPFDYLLPTTVNALIKWVIEYAPAGQSLPHYDIVFNAIGDADTAIGSRAAVDRFLAINRRPLLNPPQRIDRTARDRIGALLAGIDGIEVPQVVRWDRRPDGPTQGHVPLAAASMNYPVIARRVGAHGGEGVELLQSPQELTAAVVPGAEQLYLSSYCKYRSDDGYFRKYRIIFVDRRPYPYHLAIGSHWLTHYDTADMLPMRWKTEEEHCFLQDPIGVLGPAAWAALIAIAQRLDLDFGGVDFSVLADGRLLIFEANATMMVHPEHYHEVLKFKNPYVQRIYDAFDCMLAQRMGLGAATVAT